MSEDNRRQVKGSRINLWIYPKFQVLMLATNLVTVLFILVFVEYQVINFFSYMRKLGVKASFAEDHPFFKFVSLQESAIIKNLVVATVVGVIFSALVNLILSHRLSGPIVRLKSYFSKMSATGKIEEISFRRKDFFTELPTLINGALRSVGKDDCFIEKKGE